MGYEKIFLVSAPADSTHGGLRVLSGIGYVASRLVKRIVSYVDTGSLLVSGQRIEIIKFGSQVDILIPDTEHLDVRICVGDRIIARENILATNQQVAMRS